MKSNCIISCGSYDGTRIRDHGTSKFTFWWHQFFHLSELIIVIQAFWVEQGTRWLDRLATHNALDRQLDLLQVDSSLADDGQLLRVGSNQCLQQVLTGISGVSKMYFGACLLEHSFAIFSRTFLAKSLLNRFPGFMSKKSITLSS